MEHATPHARPPAIGLAQIDIVPGHPDRNLATLLGCIERSRDAGLELLAFPEMAVPGYFIGDEWENERFIEDCLAANEELRAASRGITVVWGSVDADPDRVNDDGRWRKYNAAFIAHDGHWLYNGVLEGKSYKTLLPNYREFDDKRHFFSLDRWAAEQGLTVEQALRPFELPATPPRPDSGTGGAQSLQSPPTRLGLMLCEDMWDADYALKPGRILAANGATVLLNLSCSPWTWRKNAKRHRVAAGLAEVTGVPHFYVNNTGIQNNGKDIYAFDGGSTFYDAQGRVQSGLSPFANGILTSQGPLEAAGTDGAPPAVVAPLPALPPAPPTTAQEAEARDIAETGEVLIHALRAWFAQNGNPQAAIGLSGGIDSALVAALLAIAIGPDRVWAVNMPSRFNSATTKNAARRLAANLGINYAVIPIQESVEHTIAQVEATEWTRPGAAPLHLTLSGLNKENIQARDRGGRVLAAVASAIGGVFTNNGNKTETAFGYATLYGDVNGALAPIGDLYKTQVYGLAAWINARFAAAQGNAAPAGPGPAGLPWPAAFSAPAGDGLIPRAIIEVVPSAELSENQNVDEGKGDPIRYDYHDRLLHQFVDGGHQENYQPGWGRRDPYDLLRWYLDGELDRRLELPEGSVARYCPNLASFCRDLEEKWLWYKRSVFKRIQSPPIIAVSRRAFGFDLRESTNGVYLSMRYRKLRDAAFG